jgi:hypothetical protein
VPAEFRPDAADPAAATMTAQDNPPLGIPELVQLARAATRARACKACAALVCPGWEAMPGSVDRAGLERIGTLRDPADEDPTVAEYHPGGTNAWSPDAPIAPAWFPYNRCDAWRCATCARAFLRYTEYGGYYTEDRIRELDARLIVDAPLA